MTQAILIGEAWGEKEEMYCHPFIGPSGAELYRMLAQAEWAVPPLDYKYISPFSMVSKWNSFPYQLLNVFNLRPRENDISTLYAGKRDRIEIDLALPSRRFNQTIQYLRAEHSHHVTTLRERLLVEQPNLIIALGATACWALGLGTEITKLRGFVHETPYGKVLPTFHPASVLRKWNQRQIVVLDLFKAKREMTFAGIRQIEREIWTEPTIPDLHSWWNQHGSTAPLLAIDIETAKGQIAEVGFASSAQRALHIPFFWNDHGEWKSYWASAEAEVQAWEFVRMVCGSEVPKIGHNLKYDVFWLTRAGIPVYNWTCDSMVAMHSYQPELEKSLSFLGSLWLDERSWKQIRKHSGKEEKGDG
jgi:uracil-DNA glycosylase